MAQTHIVMCRRCAKLGYVQLCVGATKEEAYGEFEEHVHEAHFAGGEL